MFRVIFRININYYQALKCRAIAQAVSRWLPTAAARHVGFVVDKVALGQEVSEYFGFPCQSSFHKFLHNHLSSGAGTIGH
jgi:hypothetical protein